MHSPMQTRTHRSQPLPPPLCRAVPDSLVAATRLRTLEMSGNQRLRISSEGLRTLLALPALESVDFRG